MSRDAPKNYWLPQDVTRLMVKRDVEKLSFPVIADLFPGRTKKDCANKYYLEKARLANTAGAGLAVRIPVERRSQKEIIAALQKPGPLPQHATLTAALFGDPLPGRSALDMRRAGPLPGTVPPKPTLPGMPL